MHAILTMTFFQMGFWLTWAIIPLLIEILPALYSAVRLIIKSRHRIPPLVPENFPFITIIIPIYNSADTLYRCIESVAESTYPTSQIQILLADNQSSDDSYAVAQKAAHYFDDLNMQYFQTEQGKAKALNAAIFAALGTYVINIDSDGILEKHALVNTILEFERKPKVAAMTGTILPQKRDIEDTRNPFKRLLRDNEYVEYAQAFLAGRQIENDQNHLFTLSGAFSAFRRSALLQTQLYDVATVGEDTELTFQIRNQFKHGLDFCATAIFYVEPISGWAELYTQRQRWQRGELEVMHHFAGAHAQLRNFFRNFLVRRLMLDHTFMFPKMIWLFASFVLLFFGYSGETLATSYLVIYWLYVFITAVNFISVMLTLRSFLDEERFFLSRWWVIFTLPLYNFICSWIRLIGIINAATKASEWNTTKASDESHQFRQVIKGDWRKLKEKRGE
ncbi:glycosyltransferase [Lactobacillus selangorensis]|uniref:Glycosyltransferase n=1 Tax=Lactobacillus selangorensis TaxID=81857 RepID=A0A0R2FHR5_9LACO|nr:TIGR03111 family XrtG-associated glycosyltransferase [Lactobacillus selangorensis]KRN27286.1 glycosyltransferase [Lactobacillus selangorensis]KRN29931.1 glycosyltransferase [Lactobacillus selangorensis]